MCLTPAPLFLSWFFFFFSLPSVSSVDVTLDAVATVCHRKEGWVIFGHTSDER